MACSRVAGICRVACTRYRPTTAWRRKGDVRTRPLCHPTQVIVGTCRVGAFADDLLKIAIALQPDLHCFGECPPPGRGRATVGSGRRPGVSKVLVIAPSGYWAALTTPPSTLVNCSASACWGVIPGVVNRNPTSGTGRRPGPGKSIVATSIGPRHDLAVADDRCPIGEHDLPHPSARRRVRAVHCGHLRAEAVSSVSLWAARGDDRAGHRAVDLLRHGA